jgi:hypothetical protein
MQTLGGEKIWVGNIYLPPIYNQQRRGIDEAVTRSLVEDIIGGFPSRDTIVMCGDWNTRIANLSPNLGEESTTRRSEDTQTNQRAPWLLDICEQQDWKILNGLQPGPPACNTFRRGDDSSCIDLIMTNQPSNNITYDPTTLNGLSDHVLVMTNVATPYLTRRHTAAAAK